METRGGQGEGRGGREGWGGRGGSPSRSLSAISLTHSRPHPFCSTPLNGSLTAPSLPSTTLSLSPLSLTALFYRSLFLSHSYLVKDGDRGKKEGPKRYRHNDTRRGDRITLRPHRLQDRTTRT